MAGNVVYRNTVDQRITEAVVALREASRKIETLNGWLTTVVPIVNNVDPLVTPNQEFGMPYTATEAAQVRQVAQDLASVPLAEVLEAGRMVTGLE